MAEEQINDAEGHEPENQATPKASRGSFKLLGAVVGLITLGSTLAVVAMPEKAARKSFQGPAMHNFFEKDIVGNPLDDNFSRYLKFSPSCSYFAYDIAYPSSRIADEHYEKSLRQAMMYTISRFRIDEVMAAASRETFAAALEEVAEPVLFPVHLGETPTPYDADPMSGLRLGDSQDLHGTFRGAFHEHVLKVDARRKTLQLDGGPQIEFGGAEHDVLVEAEDGTKIYVNVATLDDSFEGEVNVGVMGRIRRMFTGDIIAQ